jgi:hypothetical protein
MTYDGPFSAREAAENGLITGMSYKSHIMESIVDPEFGGKEENKFMVRWLSHSAALLF